MSKYTKLYWKTGGCNSGDYTLGDIDDGKKLCGVKATSEDTDFVTLVASGQPPEETSDSEEEQEIPACPDGTFQVFRDNEEGKEPFIKDDKRMCYAKTPMGVPGMRIRGGTLCEPTEMCLSTPDGGVNFGYIYDQKNFCAPKDTDNFQYHEIDNMEPHKASDTIYNGHLYGAQRVSQDGGCGFARDDLLYARGDKTGSAVVAGIMEQGVTGFKKFGVAGAIGGAAYGAVKGLIDGDPYERICRYVNSYPQPEYNPNSEVKYCPGSATKDGDILNNPVFTTIRSTNANSPKITCIYPKSSINKELLVKIDSDIYMNNPSGAAAEAKNRIYKELADTWCDSDEARADMSTFSTDLITSADSSGEYGRPKAAQMTCLTWTADYEAFCGTANNIADFSQTLCTRSKLGEDKYDEMWVTFCEANPSHKQCACYNTLNGKCSGSSDDIAGCSQQADDWKMLSAYDVRETSKPENSDHKYCFTRACNSYYKPENYIPRNWDAQCPPYIKICNDKVTVLKGNQMAFGQALTCMDVERDVFARTPDEQRVYEEFINELTAAMDAAAHDEESKENIPEINVSAPPVKKEEIDWVFIILITIAIIAFFVGGGFLLYYLSKK